VNCHTYDQLLYVAVGIVCSNMFVTLVKKNSVQIQYSVYDDDDDGGGDDDGGDDDGGDDDDDDDFLMNCYVLQG
jgi:hypothetical protein